jgi:hypothetical protein
MHVREHPARASRLIVIAASCATLAIGLAFVFVRAPHPWGWEGIDHYHELRTALARGEPFPTIEVPWAMCISWRPSPRRWRPPLGSAHRRCC